MGLIRAGGCAGVVERFEGEYLALRQRRVPHASPTFTEAGLALGAGTVLVPMQRNAAGAPRFDLSGEDRILAALTAAFMAPVDAAILGKLRRACDLWARRKKPRADSSGAAAPAAHRRRTGVPPLPRRPPDGVGLFAARTLQATGLPAGLKKYSPDQPRVPAGNGRASGRFGSTGGSAGARSDSSGRSAESSSYLSYADEPAAEEARAPSPPGAPTAGEAAVAEAVAGDGAAAGIEATADTAVEGTILGPLSADALAGLGAVAAGFAGAAAAFGLIFIPSPNGGLFSQGAVPGERELSYQINHDEGLLRITRNGPAGGVVVAAHLGADGLYRDETGAPIARAAGGSVVIDPDAMRAVVVRNGDAAGVETGVEAATEARREEPKLCPAPEPDKAGGRKSFDIQYEQFVRSVVNPQRQPPLPAGLAFSLTNPSTDEAVFFDDCRESDGAMIEAKGHYAQMMETKWGRDKLAVDWTDQATRQVKASAGRQIEWYFHEQAGADQAQQIFQRYEALNRIIVRYLPDPAGIPNPNRRIK